MLKRQKDRQMPPTITWGRLPTLDISRGAASRPIVKANWNRMAIKLGLKEAITKIVVTVAESIITTPPP